MDLRRIKGDYPGMERNKMGMDVSGVVEAVGDMCHKFQVGDEVIGVANGSVAEFAAGPETQWVRKPKNISFLHAAAFPLCGLAAFQLLYIHGQLKQAQKVLILNASGGIGSLVVQMAKYKKAKVYATTSTHVKWVKSLGADVVLDYKKCQWWQQLAGENIDVVIDLVEGYSAWVHCQKVVNKQKSRFITMVPDTPDAPYSFVDNVVKPKMRHIMSPRGGCTYTYMPEIDFSKGKHLNYVSKMVSKGLLKPVLDPESPFPFSTKGAAHLLKKMESKENRGKMIVDVVGMSNV